MERDGCKVIAAIAALALLVPSTGSPAGDQPTAGVHSAELPAPFVRLADIDPSIRQDMRYAGPVNFTGARVPGYEAASCILTRATATALQRVQSRLAEASRPLTLVVHDCYRPRRAVSAFVGWATAAQGNRRAYHHPRIDRAGLLERGYIARSSGHSRGHTVDATLAPVAPEPGPSEPRRAAAGWTDCAGEAGQRERAGTLDMGTAFDCFDARSHLGAGGLAAEQTANRRRLLEAMREGGFRAYEKEWWHFTHPAGDSGRAHDFPVNGALVTLQPPRP